MIVEQPPHNPGQRAVLTGAGGRTATSAGTLTVDGGVKVSDPSARQGKNKLSHPPETLCVCAKRLPGTPRAGEDGQGHIGIARRDLLLEKRSRARDRRKVASRIWRFLFAVQLPCFFPVGRPSVHVLLCPRWSAQLGGDPFSLTDFETLPVLAAGRGSR